ncbi:MAG: isocitrate lyase/phosphoenolpyruvate mutase family protein, partial [Alphaproteobacteria bacterium]
MNQAEQASKAEAFRALHRGPRLLLLPNAWDAMSARIVASEGFPAIATTSGGLAWALGYPDGEAAPWDEVVAATARIARTVSVPVTADIETGYGDTPEAVARSIGDIIGAGAVGVNLEDGMRGGPAPLRSVEDMVA